jgi:hypothetical protein
MSRQSSARSRLASKIFSTTTGIGKTVTLKSLSSPTYNTRGEVENVTTTTSSITIVPYGQVTQESKERFGDLQPGQVEAAVPYTVTVNLGDKITMEGSDWEIVAVEPNWLPDNIVTIIRMAKVLA